MTGLTHIDYIFEKVGNVGLYYLRGKLTSDKEDSLKLLLMRALHRTDRAVINLRDVSCIDDSCMKLLIRAYKISLRMKKLLIIAEPPEDYMEEIFDLGKKNSKKEYRLFSH
jgi:anti-anti-sigma regulatory factor